jgi:hypothetical protein
MQDLEIPPAVEEGEADGGAGGVPPIIGAATKNATVRTRAAVSTARPWITAIGR